MTPLLLTLASLVPFPLFHSSNRYTPPLTVAAALIEIGELTVAPSLGEQTFIPLLDGAEHPPPPLTVISRVAYTSVPELLYAAKVRV